MAVTLRYAKRIGFALLCLGVILAAALFAIYLAMQPPSLDVPEQEDTVLSNVSIWNPGSDLIAGQTITIAGGVIVDIAPTKPSDPTPLCNGCVVMPGLIDAHVHTPPELAIGNQELFALLYLKYGVTSVRDLGQLDGSLPQFAAKLNDGNLVGPRMYQCGRILGGSPPEVPGALEITTQDEARSAVANHAEIGVDCIKVYGGVSAPVFDAIAAEAERQELPLVGHTPTAMSFDAITRFESQHYTGIPYLKKPAPAGWAYKAQDLIDMSGDDVSDVIGVMKANEIAFLPTNANAMSRLTVFDAKRFPPSAGFEHLPGFWKRVWPSVVSHAETEAEVQTELAAKDVGLNFIRQAHEQGVDVLIGTDVVMPYVIPGEAMHQQLALIAQAMGSDEAALRAATHTNGHYIDPGKIGQVIVGAHADLLIFKDDPSAGLGKVLRWDIMFVNGRQYSRQDIDAAVDRYDAHFRGSFYSAVMDTAYGFLASDYADSGVSEH